MKNYSRPGQLLAAAKRARASAYAPYSGFKVGAALETSDGSVFHGCNVENASYGLTICAERAAIFSAIAGGAKGILALAVYTGVDAPHRLEAKVPCGACRQVMVEFMEPDAKIFVDDEDPLSLSELLPLPFKLCSAK